MEGKGDGVTNMARDVDLLKRAESGVGGARIYFWESVWVTLGNSQVASDVLLDLSVPHVVRPTGGAAVLHGHDLTLGIAMPLSALGCEGREVKKAFLGLTRPILAALNAVGIPAVLGRDLAGRGAVDSPYCFGMKSDYDVLRADTGEKICGCAMKVSRYAALVQASIPIGEPLVEPSRVVRDYVETPASVFDLDGFVAALRDGIGV
ncbi:MAG: hypothetical protein JST12_08525 [Armatimonadetes bacterium]|nr:hypothetical protein [Armatimonadota bacterium]